MSVDTGGERLWTSQRWPVVTGSLALMTFIAIESFAVTTILPAVAADLDGLRWYSFAYAATITAALIGMITGGVWADRAGITTPLTWGGGLFLAGIALCVVAPGMSAFLAGRFLQGLGGGIVSVLVYVIIARNVPAPLRARMFGLLATAWLVPAMAGPLVAGAVAEVWHWRVVLAAVLAGSTVALVALIAATRQPRGEGSAASGSDPSRWPVFGRRGWYAVAAAGCLVGLHLGGQRPWPGNTVALAVFAGLLLLIARVLLPRGTLRTRPGIPGLVALRGLLGAAVAATDVYLPLYLQGERGYTPSRAGLVIAIGALGWALGAWAQGRAGASANDRRSVLRATVLVFCGPVGALAFMAGASIAVTVVGCVLMGTGMGMAYPRISAAVMARSAPGSQGIDSSALQASESMSTSTILALSGVILTGIAGLGGYVAVYAIAAVLIIGAVAVGRRALGPSTPA